MLSLPKGEGIQPLEVRKISLMYQTMSRNEKTLVLTQHIPNSKPPFKIMFFKPKSRKAISLICTILGYKNDDEVDEALLIILTHIHPTTKECPKWDICGFLP